MDLGPKVKLRRQQLSLTLAEVSERCGLSKPFLSQIERGKASASLTSLTKIAQALEVTLPYFLSAPSTSGVVQRLNERRYFSLDQSSLSYASLSASLPDRQLQAVITRLPPGTSTSKETHAGEEFILVMAGELQLTLGEECQVLSVGDSAQYPATFPHQWANVSQESTEVLWVGTPALF